MKSMKSNFLYSISYQILILILPLITTPYLARMLSADSIGTYSYTQSFASYFVLFSMLGINNYGNRSIAQARDNRVKLSETFWGIFYLQLLLSIIMCSIYLYIILSSSLNNKNIYILQLFYVMSAAFDINWFYFGIEKFKITVIRNSIIKLIQTIAIFTFVKKQSDIAIYTFIIAFGTLLSQLAVWPFLSREVDFKTPQLKDMKKHVKPNFILFIPVIAISIYNIMDKIMLGILCEDSEVAYYTYAQVIAQIPVSIITALGMVMMPRISNLVAQKNFEASSKLIQKTMDYVVILSIPLAFGLAGIAQNFVPWFYGDDFKRCGVFVIWFTPTIVIKSIAHVIRTQYLLPYSKDRIYNCSVIIGAITNLVFNLFLIPELSGIGAIISTILAESIVCVIQLISSRNTFNIKEHIKDVSIYSLFGAVMFILVFSLSNILKNRIYTLLLQITIGGIFYLLILSVYIIKVKKDRETVNTIKFKLLRKE